MLNINKQKQKYMPGKEKNMENKYFDDEERLLTVTDICRIINVTPLTLFKWRREKGMPYIKLAVNGRIRYRLSDVMKWLEPYHN
ncbi:MAG: helix-turn-helix domain-containing protein [Candidatus Omnitrophica bacterium]|nr:helix-turn-helix domain-containing protein [Candidatus Omnitrophota bacterium]